jgi:selenium metabolism protein YedF
MRLVDTKGQLCPEPLIATKRALKETLLGGSFQVETDNQTSFNNLSRFLKDNNTEFKVSEAGGIWTLTITKSTADLVRPVAEEYCSPSISHFQKGNFIVVLSTDKMGEGDDKLGHILMDSFVKALKDLDELPSKIVFYNAGVKLASTGSPVLDHLKDLEKMGVELLLCGTCVNFYSLESSVAAGTLSNMYAIADVMASAGKILKP